MNENIEHRPRQTLGSILNMIKINTHNKPIKTAGCINPNYPLPNSRPSSPIEVTILLAGSTKAAIDCNSLDKIHVLTLIAV